MKQKVRTAVQVIFLILFALIIVSGSMKMWMLVIAGSIVLAVLAGRLYCGWLCPLHTLMRPVEWLTIRSGGKRRPAPRWAYSPVLRYLILLAMLILIGMTMFRGLRFPFILAMVPLAVGFTLFFHPSLWHSFLCPFGTILSFTGRAAPLRIRINRDKCNSCNLCVRACPAGSISIPVKKEPAKIDSRYCLGCFLCQNVCREGAVSYTTGRVNAVKPEEKAASQP